MVDLVITMPYHKEAASEAYGMPYSHGATQTHSKWNPLHWPRWAKIVGALAVVVVIIVAIVGGVEGSKSSAYPDYSKLTYSLTDTYNPSDFFSNFDFFTGYDPSSGFVQ